MIDSCAKRFISNNGQILFENSLRSDHFHKRKKSCVVDTLPSRVVVVDRQEWGALTVISFS